MEISEIVNKLGDDAGTLPLEVRGMLAAGLYEQTARALQGIASAEERQMYSKAASIIRELCREITDLKEQVQ